MNEDAPVNSAGDGSRVALPPAHVIVGKRSRTKYKNKDRKYDGRTKAGRKLVSRVLLNRKRKMSEELTKLTEVSLPRLSVLKSKSLSRKNSVVKKIFRRSVTKLKGKMQSKTKEMDTLMKSSPF